jgi:hypothetical protein
MPKPIDQLPSFFDALNDALPPAVAAGMSEALRVIGRGVVLDTPVDTGEARLNWTANQDSPITIFRPTFSRQGGLGKGERAIASAAIAGIERVAARFRIRGSGSKLFLTNNAPHIVLLNAGRSPQTPPGFIQRAIQFAEFPAAKKIARSLTLQIRRRGFCTGL